MIRTLPLVSALAMVVTACTTPEPEVPGALFFAETPDRYVAIGSSVIILSGMFVVWRESRENVSEKTPVLRTATPRVDTGPQPK